MQAEKAGEVSVMEYEQLRLESQRLRDKGDEIKHTVENLKSSMEHNIHVSFSAQRV